MSNKNQTKQLENEAIQNINLESYIDDLRKKQSEITILLHQIEKNLSNKRHNNLRTIEDKKEYDLKENYLILQEDVLKSLSHEVYCKITNIQTLLSSIVRENEKEDKKS